MTTVGCYISNMEDKLLSPGSYVTADEYHETRLNAVSNFEAREREIVTGAKMSKMLVGGGAHCSHFWPHFTFLPITKS